MSVHNLENRRFRLSAAALAFALAGAAAMLYYQFGLFMPRVEQVRTAKHLAGEYSFGDDFYPIWLSCRQWLDERRDPYSPALTREIQRGIFGRPLDGQFPTDPPADYRSFAYPAYTDLLLWPVSAVPFREMRLAWVALLAALLAATVVIWARTLAWPLTGPWLGVALLLTLCSYPELEGLDAGQLGLLVGFLLAASFLALVRNKQVIAGILMALATIKPQMVALAIVYLFFWSTNDWRHRRQVIVTFFATMVVLIAASLAVWPHWIQSWTRIILAYPRYAKPPLVSEILGASLAPVAGPILITVLLLAALALAWRGRAVVVGSDNFFLTLSILFAITTITLLPGQAVHDHVILLPGIFLLASQTGPEFSSLIFRALLFVGIAVLCWPWAAALVLILLRPLLSPELFNSKAVFVLPLRTAAVFPFLVLALLFLTLRARRKNPRSNQPRSTEQRGLSSASLPAY